MLATFVAGAQSRGRSSSANRGTSHSVKSTSHSKRGHASESGRKFNFSIGLSLALSNTVTTLSDAGGSATITRSTSAFGIFAYPKYSFYSTEKFSISIGVPLTLAFSGSASANSRTGSESSGSFLYDLPLMIDYNGGIMAPQQRYGEKRFGYFVGAGFGVENADATSYSYVGTGTPGGISDYTKAKSVGPNLHAGFVFRIGSEEHPRFLGARLSYKICLNTDKFNYFTPSVFLNL